MNNILIVGDIIIDKYINCSFKKIAQEFSCNVLNIENEKTKLGGAANVMSNVCDFYDKIYLISAFDDSSENKVREHIKCINNINYVNIKQNNREVPIKTRIINDNNCLIRYDKETINELDIENENEIIKYINNISKEIKICIISDYGKGFLTNTITRDIINICNNNNIFILVDPKGKNFDKYKNATLIKPNKSELYEALGFDILIDKEKILEYMKKTNIKYMINTLGENGICYLSNDTYLIKECNKSVVLDVTGCGDSIISAISVYLFENNYKVINENCLLETLIDIGSKSVGTLGCFVLNKNIWNTVYKKDTVVFTNGCFDIVHVGHLKLLKECKKLGTRLIVALNSDSSIKRIKGKNRPINDIKKRVEFISELDIADEIIVFDEDTPETILKDIRPNIIVKGGDYKINEIIGSMYADRVVIIPFVKGFSTSNTIGDILTIAK